MTTGLQRHLNRQADLAAMGRALARRAHSSCELCGARETSLSTAEVDPLPESPHMDHAVLLCNACSGAIEGGSMEESQARFLEVAVWSELPPIQVLAVRLTRRLAAEGVPWAVPLLDDLYLPPEIEHRLGA